MFCLLVWCIGSTTCSRRRASLDLVLARVLLHGWVCFPFIISVLTSISFYIFIFYFIFQLTICVIFFSVLAVSKFCGGLCWRVGRLAGCGCGSVFLCLRVCVCLFMFNIFVYIYIYIYIYFFFFVIVEYCVGSCQCCVYVLV